MLAEAQATSSPACSRHHSPRASVHPLFFRRCWHAGSFVVLSYQRRGPIASKNRARLRIFWIRIVYMPEICQNGDFRSARSRSGDRFRTRSSIALRSAEMSYVGSAGVRKNSTRPYLVRRRKTYRTRRTVSPSHEGRTTVAIGRLFAYGRLQLPHAGHGYIDHRRHAHEMARKKKRWNPARSAFAKRLLNHRRPIQPSSRCSPRSISSRRASFCCNWSI